MSSLLLPTDPDFLLPDNPDEIQPDQDESLADWLVPSDDDSIELWQPNVLLPLTKPRSLVSVSGVPNVPFPRVLRLGTSGKDVIAHKRALSRARPDLYKWQNFSTYCGTFFIDAFVEFKKSHGLGKTTTFGGTAHETLERQHRHNHPSEWAFDAYAIKLAQDYWDAHNKTPEQRVRDAIVQAGFFWYAHRSQIHYSQYRPFQQGKPTWVPTFWDCSAFVTVCHYAGGAPNPNGRAWDHLGYTGTLMSRGTRVASVVNLLPGDLIFYGSSRKNTAAFPKGSPTHVALYVGKLDKIHMVLSMGSYPMVYAPYNYRHDINHFRHYKVA